LLHDRAVLIIKVTQKGAKRLSFGVTFCKFLQNHDILSMMVRKSSVFFTFLKSLENCRQVAAQASTVPIRWQTSLGPCITRSQETGHWLTGPCRLIPSQQQCSWVCMVMGHKPRHDNNTNTRANTHPHQKKKEKINRYSTRDNNQERGGS
jgi:hypothetical protein